MIRVWVFFGLFLVGQVSVGADLEAAAEDFCGCMEAPYALIEATAEKMEEAQITGDFDSIMALQNEMMSVMSEASDCFDELPAKYPEIDQSEALQAQVIEMTAEQCPNPAGNFPF